MTDIAASPRPIMGLFDEPFWASIRARALKLQQCTRCRNFRYPPSAVCPECLSPDHDWIASTGRGEILSWVIFHRGYLPAYPPPYNVIAVRLIEGPIVVSNLTGPEPDGNWIGATVSLVYEELPDGLILPRFVLD
jgi:uncharacterized OB-fold protein